MRTEGKYWHVKPASGLIDIFEASEKVRRQTTPESEFGVY